LLHTRRIVQAGSGAADNLGRCAWGIVTLLPYLVIMKPSATPTLLEHASEWDELSRWERAELGRALRRLGWSYGEIMDLIPVPKGTLAYWCRSVELPHEQKAAIRTRTGSWKGVPRDTQRKRRAAAEQIRATARDEVLLLMVDPRWLAGTVMYWGEGGKTGRTLQMTNSDPRVLRLFMTWVTAYLESRPRFVLQLHLHEENDDTAARDYWAGELAIAQPDFYKTYVKPKGTGYRKNHLQWGVCSVRLRRSADAWIQTAGWIDGLAAIFEEPGGIS